MIINIPKGTKDVLPSESGKWQYLEELARNVARAYNLSEVRTPTFEHTELFSRSVGDATDIVNKEMYTFEDKGGRSITLKPEGTAGVARCYIENGMGSLPQPVKMYYFTPVFRYERPQAGRLREHRQFGVEIYGDADAGRDAECIAVADAFLKKAGVKDLHLFINSVGCPDCRPAYNAALKKYFTDNIDKICETCRERLNKNPLRILDCKAEGCRGIIAGAPKTTDSVCGSCAGHFEKLQRTLGLLGVVFTVNPGVVRGLDYYTRTVFEFVTGSIGAQSTVCGGGRYDSLIGQLGGAPTPAVGFGLGLERLLLLLENTGVSAGAQSRLDAYVAGFDTGLAAAARLTAELRSAGLCAETEYGERSLKSQLKYAQKAGARFSVIIGPDEAASGIFTLRDMDTSEERKVPADAVAEMIQNKK
ncbi:MAG: histidine--tRNA ligase [Firmicutes bacterium]|nr:histidine--tRNA ligase [Bacillota bacterium]